MSQISPKRIGRLAAVRTAAWRAGYQDYYEGLPPRFDFDVWGKHHLLYEVARQTAAFATGKGIPRVAIPAGRMPATVSLALAEIAEAHFMSSILLFHPDRRRAGR